MNRGLLISSFHTIRTNGRKALKLLKERENEMLLVAAASTPFSVRDRKAR